MKRPRAKTRLCTLDPAGIPINKLSLEELQRAFGVAGLKAGDLVKNDGMTFLREPPTAIREKPLKTDDPRETPKAKHPGKPHAYRLVLGNNGKMRFIRTPRMAARAKTPQPAIEGKEACRNLSLMPTGSRPRSATSSAARATSRGSTAHRTQRSTSAW